MHASANTLKTSAKFQLLALAQHFYKMELIPKK